MNMAVKCIMGKAASGIVSQDAAKTISKLVDRLEQLGGNKDELSIAREAENMFRDNLAQKNKQTVLTIQKQLELYDLYPKMLQAGMKHEDIVHQLSGFAEPAIRISKGKALSDLGAAMDKTFEQQMVAKQNQYGYMVSDALRAYDQRIFGKASQRRAINDFESDLWNLLEEGGNNRSKDPVTRNMSEKFAKVFQKGADDINALGGSIKERADYPFGAFSDAEKVRAIDPDVNVARQKWVSEFKAMGGSIEKLKRNIPGLDDSQVDDVLSKAFDSLVTGNPVSLSEYLPNTLKTINDQVDYHRLLQFDTLDGFKQYNEKYGQGNIFDIAMNYILRTSRKVASLENYGPSPQTYKNTLLDILRGYVDDPAKLAKMSDLIDSNIRYNTNTLYRGLYPNLNEVGSSLRNVLVSTKLGSTFLQHIVDEFGVMPLGRALIGLPVWAALKESLSNIIGTSNSRKELARIGWGIQHEVAQFRQDIMDYSTGGNLGAASKLTQKAASWTVHYSGLERATEGARGGSIARAAIDMADLVQEGVLDKKRLSTQNWLKSYGITDKDLELAREHGVEPINTMEGIKDHRLNLGKMFDHPDPEVQNAGLKFAGMTNDLAQMATPTKNPNLDKAFVALKNNPIGAVVAQGAQPFTGWPGGWWRYFIRPLLNSPDPVVQKSMFATTAFLTMMALQMTYETVKDMAINGKDAEPMSMEKFGRSFAKLTGPALDAMLSYGNSMQDGLIDRMMPGAGMLKTFEDLLVKDPKALIQGQSTHFAKDFVNVLGSVMPANAVWMYALAFKRLVFDQLRKAMDPDSERQFQHMVLQSQHEKDQGYWWRPGQLTPDRAPDLSKVFSWHTPPVSRRNLK